MNETTAPKRPRGTNADEWHLFLCEYLDNRATTAGDGLAFIAVQIADAIEAAFEAWPHRDQQRPWLLGSWGWRVIRDDGLLLADGEGCSCVEVALETASIVAREEFQINGR